MTENQKSTLKVIQFKNNCPSTQTQRTVVIARQYIWPKYPTISVNKIKKNLE